ncbi:MAG: outer membrane beta-barrel protein [Stellaceae bacterium]
MIGRIAASLVGLGVALAPGLGWAQAFTDPLVPVPPVPLSPTVPVAPGQYLLLGQSVTDRFRPEVSPLGIRFGDFFFFPRAEVDEAYDDNIFATTTAKTNAFITLLQPGFDIRSNLPQNALNVSAGGLFTRYSNNTSLNTDDGFGDVNGRLDVDNTHYFTGDVRVERTHFDLGAPQVVGNADTPLRLTDYNATVGFDQYRLRIGYEVTATVRREEYDALPLVGGGFASESNLDNFTYAGAARIYYEFIPGYQGYVRGGYNMRDYDHGAGNGVPTLSSTGYRVDVGGRINLTGVTYIDGFVGYLDQDYQASSFGSVGGVDFGATVKWNVTQLTSLGFTAGRTVEDVNNTVLVGTATTTSPGYLESTAGFTVDHELLRNVLINGTLSYTNDAFQNITRTDNIYGAGVGGKYLLNRYFYLGGTYTYSRVLSTGQAAMIPYSRNIFLLRLSTQL